MQRILLACRAAGAAPRRFVTAGAPVRSIAGWMAPRAGCAAVDRPVVARRCAATTTAGEAGEDDGAAEVDLGAALATSAEEDNTAGSRASVAIPDLTSVRSFVATCEQNPRQSLRKSKNT